MENSVASLVSSTGAKEEAKSKRRLPEVDAWLFTQWTYGWMTLFIWHGFKKPIDFADLFELTPDLKSATLSADFERLWAEEKSKNPELPVSVFKIIYRQFGRLYAFIGIYHLIQAAANISAPIFVGLITSFAENTEAAVKAGGFVKDECKLRLVPENDSNSNTTSDNWQKRPINTFLHSLMGQKSL